MTTGEFLLQLWDLFERFDQKKRIRAGILTLVLPGLGHIYALGRQTWRWVYVLLSALIWVGVLTFRPRLAVFFPVLYVVAFIDLALTLKSPSPTKPATGAPSDSFVPKAGKNTQSPRTTHGHRNRR